MVDFKEIAIGNCDFRVSKIKKDYLIEIAICYCNFNKFKIKKNYFNRNRNTRLRFQ